MRQIRGMMKPFGLILSLWHRSGPRPTARSAKMVHFLEAIHRCRNAFHSRLELERKKLRIVARLVQVTAMEPKRLLLCRLPHVPLLAFPWARIFGRIRAESPDLAYLVSDLPGDKVRGPAVHRTVAGSVNDEIGRQLSPVAQDYGIFREFFDIDAALQSDAAIGNQFRSTNIDVVSGPAP